MNVHGCLQLGFINLAVMQQHLAQEFFRIVGSRTDNQPVLEVDLFDDAAAADFERTCLATCRQKLEHVCDTHCVKSSANSHQINLLRYVSGRVFCPRVTQGKLTETSHNSTKPDYIFRTPGFKS